MDVNVLINKASSIEQCLKRIKNDYEKVNGDIANNLTQQDAIVLNIQRACQSAIDMGAHYIRAKKFGIPQSSQEIFKILGDNKVIEPQLTKRLQGMVGFRNIAIHDYQAIDLDIVIEIIEKRMKDISQFKEALLQKVMTK